MKLRLFLRQSIERHFAAIALLIIILECLLFRMHIMVNVAPYYPPHHDQAATYYTVYEAFFSLRDHGFLHSLRIPLSIKTLGFRGWLVPVLSLGTVCLFGPNRLSVVSVNFLFLAMGQVVIWRFLRRSRGPSAAMLGSGLFLLSGTHYLWVGGITDMRLDYAGMVVFGLSFLSLLELLSAPRASGVLSCLLVFALLLATRSIAMVYLLGAQVALLACFSLQRLLRRGDSLLLKRLKCLGLLLIGSLLESGMFWAAFGRGFTGYYVRMLVTDEKAIRSAEFGVSTLRDRILYYPASALVHFHDLVILAMVFGAYAALEWGWCRWMKGPSANQGDPRKTFQPVVALGAVGLSTCVAASLYAPSPVVIGVLSIPLAVVLAIVVTDGLDHLEPIVGVRIIGPLVAAIGLGTYGVSMVAPRNIPIAARHEAKVVGQFFKDLERVGAEQPSSATYWMLIHDGLDWVAFSVYLYEQGAEDMGRAFRHIKPTIFALREEALRANLAAADLVIAPLRMPPGGGFEYPLTPSVRSLQGVWKPILDGGFTLRHTYNLPRSGWVAGLFVRRARIIGYRAPNGLEWSDGALFFWLGNAAADIEIQNLGTSERTVEFVADTEPGPSNVGTDRRRLAYEYGDKRGTLVIGQDTRWQMSISLTLRPGANVLSLRGLDLANPALNPKGDPRPLLLRLNNMRLLQRSGGSAPS